METTHSADSPPLGGGGGGKSTHCPAIRILASGNPSQAKAQQGEGYEGTALVIRTLPPSPSTHAHTHTKIKNPTKRNLRDAQPPFDQGPDSFTPCLPKETTKQVAGALAHQAPSKQQIKERKEHPNVAWNQPIFFQWEPVTCSVKKGDQLLLVGSTLVASKPKQYRSLGWPSTGRSRVEDCLMTPGKSSIADLGFQFLFRLKGQG